MKGFDGEFKLKTIGLSLHSFDTEHDLKLCINALNRLMSVMSEDTIFNINKELEPYRRKAAREMDREIESERTD